MSTEARAQVAPERIMQLGWGYAPTLMIEAAIHHHVFDVLDVEAKTIEQVSVETNASVRGLRALSLRRDIRRWSSQRNHEV